LDTAEKVFKVRDQSPIYNETKCTIAVAAEAYISTARRGSLVVVVAAADDDIIIIIIINEEISLL